MSKQTKILLRIAWVHTKNVVRVLAGFLVAFGIAGFYKVIMLLLHDVHHWSWTESIAIPIAATIVAVVVLFLIWVEGGFDGIAGYFRGVREQVTAEVERAELEKTSDGETLLRGSKP